MTARWTRLTFIASVVFIVVLSAIVPTAAQGPIVRNSEQAPANRTIAARTARAGGVKLQYLTAGRGPAVVLLHGYAETSRMWRPLMPLLAEHFTVVAPDLPGIGGSDIPRDGLDMTAYRQRFGTDALEDCPELQELESRELAYREPDRLRLTDAGLERSDTIGPWLYSPRVTDLMNSYELR